MEIHFSPEIQAKQGRAAAEKHSDVDEYVQRVVESHLDHEEWFREQVQQGLDELDAGQFVTHEEVRARIEKLFRSQMEVRWAPRAADDLERIVRYIQQDDAEAARRVAQTIYERAGGLKTLPNRGRPGRMEGTRELALPPFRSSSCTASERFAHNW